MTREEMASTWWYSLSDRERRSLIERFREQHGGDAVPEPTALELFDSFNRKDIVLMDETPSVEP